MHLLNSIYYQIISIRSREYIQQQKILIIVQLTHSAKIPLKKLRVIKVLLYLFLINR